MIKLKVLLFHSVELHYVTRVGAGHRQSFNFPSLEFHYNLHIEYLAHVCCHIGSSEVGLTGWLGVTHLQLDITMSQPLFRPCFGSTDVVAHNIIFDILIIVVKNNKILFS